MANLWKNLVKFVEKVDLSGLYYIYVRDTSNNYSLKNAQITIDNTTEWIFKYDSDERIREFRIPRSGKYLVEVIGGRGGNNIQENNPSLNCAKNYSGYGMRGSWYYYWDYNKFSIFGFCIRSGLGCIWCSY